MRNALAVIGVVAIALIAGMIGAGGIGSLFGSLSPVGTEESSTPVPNVVESVRSESVWEGAEVLVTATPNSECSREIFGLEIGSSEDTGLFIGTVEAEMDLSGTQVTATERVAGSPRTWTIRVQDPVLQPARIDPDLTQVDHDRSGWSCGGRTTMDLWREAEGMLDEAARETDAQEIARKSFDDWVTNLIVSGEPDAVVVVEFEAPATPAGA